jgi:hypothetical protein
MRKLVMKGKWTSNHLATICCYLLLPSNYLNKKKFNEKKNLATRLTNPQAFLSNILDDLKLEELLETSETQADKASLRAVGGPRSGAFLTAVPIANLGQELKMSTKLKSLTKAVKGYSANSSLFYKVNWKKSNVLDQIPALTSQREEKSTLRSPWMSRRGDNLFHPHKKVAIPVEKKTGRTTPRDRCI